MRYRRRQHTDDWDRDDVVADGGTVHVPIQLADGVGRAVHDHYHRTRMTLADMIRATGPHKPGPVLDSLHLRMSTRDAAALAGAMARKEWILDQRAKIGDNLWRDGPAVSISPREATPIQRPLNSPPPIGEPVAYGEATHATLPPDDDDDDDDENGNGMMHMGSMMRPPDPMNGREMDMAMRARDNARAMRDVVGDRKWKDMGGTLPGMPMRNWPEGNLTPPNRGLRDPGRDRSVYAMGNSSNASGVLDPRHADVRQNEYLQMIGQRR
jgi:hypothetical protein